VQHAVGQLLNHSYINVAKRNRIFNSASPDTVAAAMSCHMPRGPLEN